MDILHIFSVIFGAHDNSVKEAVLSPLYSPSRSLRNMNKQTQDSPVWGEEGVKRLHFYLRVSVPQTLSLL